MMKNNTLRETQTYLDICVASQQLTVYKDGNSIRQYPISTAKNGLGELSLLVDAQPERFIRLS